MVKNISKTAVIVWRQILEELEKVAKARLAASEIYYEKCAEPAKPLKNAKVQCLKKLVSQLSLIQSEVAQSVLEMTKAHKIYIADETQTNDAKQKAMEADEKLKRKSVGFFKSMTSLQRNCSKLTTRYEQCATKSTASRNEYLLCQSAANAHQIRYYSVDLPELMKALDGEVYERIQDYFTIHTSTSAEVSAIETNCFQKLSHEAEKISRNYNLQCFLHESNVFTDLLQYQFEPCCNDQVIKLSQEYGASHQLEKEARKWATKISKETKAIREHIKTMKALQNQLKSDVSGGAGTEKSDSAGQDTESQLEELKQNMRRAETAKMKAEARIELLRNIGINVDEWLTNAQTDSLAAEPDAVSRTPSQASVRTESSSGPTEEPEATYTHFDDDDDYVEEVAEIEQVSMSPAIQSSSSSRQYPIYAQALYTFQATNSDELGLEENESIEVIGDGDGDGWVQAKDSQGQIGFIPESYVRFLEDGEQPSMQPTTTASMETYDPSSSLDMPSMSSPPHAALSTPDLPPAPDIPPATDLTAEEIRAAGQDNNDMPPPPDFTMTNHMEPPSDVSHYDVASSFSSGDLEVQQATAQTTSEIPAVPNLPLIPNDGEIWARALYDYEGNTDDELSFTEGTYIRIIRKDENGIDDGFWQGEIEGEIGVFPSLVVEELVENGEPEQDLLTPVKGGPPDFAPPPPVMVTLPTPDRLTPPSLSNGQAKTDDSTSTTTTTTTTTTASTGEQVSEPKECEKPPTSDIEGSSDSAAASEETKDVNAVAETEVVDAEQSKTTDSSKPEESTKQTSGSLDQVESAVESDLPDQQQNLDSKPGSLDQSQDKAEPIGDTESLEKTESSSKTKSANGTESSEQATSVKDSSSVDKPSLHEETSADSKTHGEDSQTFKSSDEFGQPIENNVSNAVTDDDSMKTHDDNIVATLPAVSSEPSVEPKKEEVEGEKERVMEKGEEHEEEKPEEGAEMKKPADDGEQDVKKEEVKDENVEDNTEMDILL
ncbi:F-BAR and double SH3 domains protein 2-like isoform X3 [Octopus vulgaris]|uniref:F-BAR and double SH3 domains protein 2-like isoform X3 n=2 Tax=Octopus TaxID=6643 RepID=A0AA36FHD7_OCTVU|nr:F-BAR and double SH3 domains protein 2-like isoform X3 [Octopus vulgaris]